MNAQVQSTAGNPQWSATHPRSVTPRPPAPIAKPTISPDAMPGLRGRYACPRTTDTVNVETNAAPKRPSATMANGLPLVSRNRTPSGVAATNPHVMNGRVPQRSAMGPRRPRRGGGRARHHRQHREEDRGDDHGRHDHAQRSGETEPRDERRDERRAERDADVPAEREPGKRRGLAVAGHAGGRAIALGMIGGHAEP